MGAGAPILFIAHPWERVPAQIRELFLGRRRDARPEKSWRAFSCLSSDHAAAMSQTGLAKIPGQFGAHFIADDRGMAISGMIDLEEQLVRRVAKLRFLLGGEGEMEEQHG